MTTKTTNSRFCDCGQYCLNSKCTTSDSGKTVRRCWCADCKERRAQIKRDAYRIVAEQA